MFRMNKLSDYGLVLLTYFARHPDRPQLSACELATEAHLPLPTVGKVLKTLTREGLLESHRGARGGYCLARRPDQITVTEIVRALEGPIAITECTDHAGMCEYESDCPTRPHFKRINLAILQALDQVTLLELAYPVDRMPTGLRGGGAQLETVFPLPAASPGHQRLLP